MVEQSRQIRPDWIDEVQPVWQLNHQEFEYVASKQRVLDITLGLDQAYQAAISEMQLKVQRFFLDYWVQKGVLSQISDDDKALFELEVEQTLQERLDGASVQDMYFEKISLPVPGELLDDFYTIFVLVRLDRAQLSELFRLVQQSCRESSQKVLMKLAADTQVFPPDF